MPFGLTNAPATFQRTMNAVLRSYLYKFAVVYLDDVLIYSETYEDHLIHLKNIIETILKHHLQINTKKSVFFEQKID